MAVSIRKQLPKQLKPYAFSKDDPRRHIPKRCGRRKVLDMIDTMIGKEKNLERLRVGLQELFDTSPVSFYERFIFPLIPKEMAVRASVESEGEGAMPLRLIFETVTSQSASKK